jgi:hypothetical protein
MTVAAQEFLRSFQALPEADQHDVLVSLLRLPIEAVYAVPTDEELTDAAVAVFLDIEKTEPSS